MGPALVSGFQAHGATVCSALGSLAEPTAAAAAIAQVLQDGPLDAIVANLAIPAPSTPAADVSDDEWRLAFATMVDPLPRLLAAALPHFRARGGGKLLVMGSAAALRGQKRTSSYSAARGAQLGWVQAVGVELAPENIQVNAIAQNFVENPTYFPPEVQAHPRFQERLKREVPLGRLVKADEDVAFAAYLCSAAADCFVGQVFPVSGGWALR
jgi:2-keto-3-deoxy-L-fuconate dehydrogenase